MGTTKQYFVQIFHKFEKSTLPSVSYSEFESF